MVLHTDAFGLEDVYVTAQDGALYFSSVIEPLIDLLDGGARTDWTAWADIIALGYPVGDRTQFDGIRRIAFASGWRCDSETVPAPFAFEPFWLGVSPRGSSPTPHALAGVIGSSVGRHLVKRPHVTLSGGWDSRLLAAAVRRKSLRTPVAWTTSTDDGFDLDVQLSRPVAESLGLDHRVRTPPESADVFIRATQDVQRRTEFQTWMHSWLQPLASELHAYANEPLYDGLAGDVLLKSLYVDEAVVDRRPEERLGHVWRNLSVGAGAGDEAIFSAGASRFITEASESSFITAMERVRGHWAEPTLAVLLTRTARGVALSPRRIFGPECKVELPFFDLDVVVAALAVPIEDKIGGDYYRDLLRSAAPTVSNLASTNDGVRKPEAGLRRQALPGSIEWLAKQVMGSSDAASLLSPALQAKLDHIDELQRVCRYSRPLRLLQTAALLARWQAAHARSLTDIGFSPWGDSRPLGT